MPASWKAFTIGLNSRTASSGPEPDAYDALGAKNETGW